MTLHIKIEKYEQMTGDVDGAVRGSEGTDALTACLYDRPFSWCGMLLRSEIPCSR
jgi:hypothetical protein